MCSNKLASDFTCGFSLGSSETCGVSPGTLYSVERGAAGIRLPDQTPSSLDGGLKASICLMKHLEDNAIPELKQQNVTSWTYIGMEVGSIWSYPGRVRGRNNATGLEQWNYCTPYDPRRRPWYHEGATGPLDMVLVVDISESMNEVIQGSSSRWEIVQDSLVKFIDTVTFTDSFNIVFFNFEGSSVSTGLLPGTPENKEKAKEFIADAFPSGGTNFQAAFETAFNALRIGVEEGTSSNCNKVILFMTDGKDNRVQVDANRTFELLDKVEELQKQLEFVSTKRASIFTFSIGELADDNIPRQLSCLHNGAWAPIGAKDDPLTVFNTFLKFVASARSTTKFYWSEVYEDASGLGQMLSIALPVFTPQNDENIPGALFGVAAHDIVLNELIDFAGANLTDQLIRVLHTDSQECDAQEVNQCLQQVLRGETTECPDRGYMAASCVKYVEKYYTKSASRTSWVDARSQCQIMGGKLVVPLNVDEQAFLSGFASVEGSWIGLSFDGLQWIWEETINLLPEQYMWAYGQESFSEEDLREVMCGSISPSGTKNNMYSHPCRDSYTYVCEFDTQPTICGNDLVDVGAEDYIPSMLAISQCTTTESLNSIRFFDEVGDLSELKPKDLYCEDDFSKPTLTQSFEDLLCCRQL
eukprot:TRINITY_DN1842_c0_g2_i1.p1 TRINITY_DN1842_c0_g2~~TRINITY_DN1842_c0_g2_i1.p1  ORF type:complete len:749 (-),score=78.85 TRINITY_DN1842_c0_g2_i1:943-2865(-)